MVCAIYEDEETGATSIALVGLDSENYQKLINEEIEIQFFPDVYFEAETTHLMPDVTNLVVELYDERVYFEIYSLYMPDLDYTGSIYLQIAQY